MPKKLTRQEIFSLAAKKMRQDFETLRPVPHRGLKGHEAEKLVKEFLRNHLPKRFDVGSGFIIDPKGDVSKQTDVVIYDAFNCPMYRVSDDAAFFPSDNVAAVVEVKSKLNKKELFNAFENIAAAKSLAKTKAPPNLPYLSLTQTFGCLFAFESSINLRKILEHYEECIQKVGLGRQIDLICILDRGLVTLSANLPGDDHWNTTFIEGIPENVAEGMHIGISAFKSGEDSLDGFLRLLLPQLIFFRGMVSHPGFNWQETLAKGEGQVKYLMSFTNEKDPVLKKRKLDEYAAKVKEDFKKNPVPDKW